jgi:hypothetical protein
MFTVLYWVESVHGGFHHWVNFETEREARQFINARANGSTTYSLLHADEMIVRSAFPVLMVA